MKRMFLLFVLVGTYCYGQIPTGYYNSAQGLTGNSLMVALHNIIDGHNTVSYNNLYSAYKKTDKKPNGKIWDMYSDIPGGTPPYEFTFVNDECGSYSAEGDCFNREHSFPQSWFNSVSGPQSDLFHVYPTDGYVNNRRSNYPFGTVTNPTWTSQNGSKLGPCSDPGYSGTVFEPIDEYKGDFARTYFYMSTRYYSEDGGWSSSPATNKSTLLPWQIKVLVKWHHQDTVSSKEIARNDSIYYMYQNNRNPFIDNPQWVDSIWPVSPVTSLEEGQNFSIVIYPNPAEEYLFFLENDTKALQEEYRIFDTSGRIVKQGKLVNQEIYIADLEKGIYYLSLSNDNIVWGKRFIKI